MNQKLLGALRAVGVLVLFTILTALISIIPDALSQLPLIGGLVTPTMAAALTALAFAGEHELAVKYGYNLPAATTE